MGEEVGVAEPGDGGRHEEGEDRQEGHAGVARGRN